MATSPLEIESISGLAGRQASTVSDDDGHVLNVLVGSAGVLVKLDSGNNLLRQDVVVGRRGQTERGERTGLDDGESNAVRATSLGNFRTHQLNSLSVRQTRVQDRSRRLGDGAVLVGSKLSDDVGRSRDGDNTSSLGSRVSETVARLELGTVDGRSESSSRSTTESLPGGTGGDRWSRR